MLIKPRGFYMSFNRGRQLRGGGLERKFFSCLEDDSQRIVEFTNTIKLIDGSVDHPPRKGRLCNRINAYIMNFLKIKDIPTCFVEIYSIQESLLESLNMSPFYCELKNDEGFNKCFGIYSRENAQVEPVDNLSQTHQMMAYTYKVHAMLKELFAEFKLNFIGIRVRFGINKKGEVVLSSQFSLSDYHIMDGDNRVTSYEEVARRLGLPLA